MAVLYMALHEDHIFKCFILFRTSVANHYVEADEPSLYSRREKLSLQYPKGLYYPSNPAHEVTFPQSYVDLYEQKPLAINSFRIRSSPHLESANINPANCAFFQGQGDTKIDCV